MPRMQPCAVRTSQLDWAMRPESTTNRTPSTMREVSARVGGNHDLPPVALASGRQRCFFVGCGLSERSMALLANKTTEEVAKPKLMTA